MKPILLLNVDGPLNVWRAKNIKPNYVADYAPGGERDHTAANPL